jgi:hypothetical protein
VGISVKSRGDVMGRRVAQSVHQLDTANRRSLETGARNMTLSREKWLRTMLTTLAVMIAPVSTSTALAQGYGADPFRPYNSQYDAYTYPMGPASPAGGGRSSFLPRMGNMGANQFQGYLDELSGAGRQGTEKYGIGMPYYRSAVDPTFDTKGTREYRPNRVADEALEQTNEVITRKYLAYFTEKDPKKRAELLRDYNRTRSRVSRALSGGREGSSRLLDAANGTGTERRGSAIRGRDAEDLGQNRDKPRSASRLSGRESSTTETGRRAATNSIPPAPALPGLESYRRTITPRRSPTEVLDRSRRLGRDVRPTPSTGAPAAADSGAARQPLPTPPE